MDSLAAHLNQTKSRRLAEISRHAAESAAEAEEQDALAEAAEAAEVAGAVRRALPPGRDA